MSADNDKGKPPPCAPAGPGGPGGVQHDARGNAVWQWAVDTGKHALESTSRLLKRLEVPGLNLEDDAPKAKVAPKPDRQAGYDPYGGRGSSKQPAIPARAASATRPATPSRPTTPSRPDTPSRPTTPSRPAKTPVATPAARPSLWQRLFRKD